MEAVQTEARRENLNWHGLSPVMHVNFRLEPWPWEPRIIERPDRLLEAVTYRSPGFGLCKWCKIPTPMHCREKRYLIFCNNRCAAKHRQWKLDMDVAA